MKQEFKQLIQNTAFHWFLLILFLASMGVWYLYDKEQASQQEAINTQQEAVNTQLQQAFNLGKAQILLNATKDFEDDGEIQFSPMVLDSEGKPILDENGNLQRRPTITLIQKEQ